MRTLNIVASAVVATAALLGTHAAQAAVSSQVKNFNISSGPVSSPNGPAQLTLVDSPNVLSGTFNPFNSSLGTLDSFKITWDLTFGASGEVGDQAGFSGGITVTGGGSFYVGASSYTGTGGNGSASGTLGDSLSPSFNVQASQVFLPGNAGLSYNPAILSLVTGASTFNLTYDENIVANYFRIVDLTGLVTGSVTLDYNYTPAPVPEPSTWLMLGGGLAALGAMRRRQQRRTAKPA